MAAQSAFLTRSADGSRVFIAGQDSWDDPLYLFHVGEGLQPEV
jgi:hypothetical protein